MLRKLFIVCLVCALTLVLASPAKASTVDSDSSILNRVWSSFWGWWLSKVTQAAPVSSHSSNDGGSSADPDGLMSDGGSAADPNGVKSGSDGGSAMDPGG